MNKPIQELLDESLAIKEKHTRSGCFSPSSFGACFRKQYWNRLDVTPINPPDARSLRIFAVGHIFHSFIQDKILADNPDIKKEVLIKNKEGDVLGYADLVNENEVIDIKSQHSKSFWWMTQKDCDIKKEKFNNWLQVMWYAQELGKKYARLVFVSKDDLCIQEYKLPFDEYWKNEILKELTILRGFWEKKELPPAEPRYQYSKKEGKPKECELYCQFRDLCYKTK